MKKHGTIHHLVPKSRGGPKKSWNEKRKQRNKHRAWHTLFVKLLPCEAINNIENFKTVITLTEKQIQAAQLLFGDDSLSWTHKAIKIIKKDWMPKGCFQFKQCYKFHDPEKICPLIKLHEKGLDPKGSARPDKIGIRGDSK